MATRGGLVWLACMAMLMPIVGSDLSSAQSGGYMVKIVTFGTSQFLVVDDQLCDVTGALGMPGESRATGATLDNDSVTWTSKFNGWEAGVIPIEFASDVSQ